MLSLMVFINPNPPVQLSNVCSGHDELVSTPVQTPIIVDALSKEMDHQGACYGCVVVK